MTGCSSAMRQRETTAMVVMCAGGLWVGAAGMCAAPHSSMAFFTAAWPGFIALMLGVLLYVRQ